MPHYLANWAQYVSPDDYAYLIYYIENARNNVPNNKMVILLGPGATGKSKLMDDITDYIGYADCQYRDKDLSFKPIVKMALSYNIAANYTSKRYIQNLKNIIQYGQSIITCVNSLEWLNTSIVINHSLIINMNHVFDTTIPYVRRFGIAGS